MLRGGAIVVHEIAALITIGAFIVHVYMGLFVVPGGFARLYMATFREDGRHTTGSGTIASAAVRPPGIDREVTAFSWHQRILRAGQLSPEERASAVFLRFYARVARFQKGIYERLKPHAGNYDPALLKPDFLPFLRLVRDIGAWRTQKPRARPMANRISKGSGPTPR